MKYYKIRIDLEDKVYCEKHNKAYQETLKSHKETLKSWILLHNNQIKELSFKGEKNMKKNTRIAEILINEEWIKVNPIDIKKGNIFRMFESTGEPVIGDNNSVNWKAENDAKYNEDGIVVIDICD